MSCSCRVAPMRSFIRGLAQVHKLDPSSSSSFRFTADSGVNASRRIIAVRSTRAFHGARRLRQDASAEAPAPQMESRQESPVDSGSSKGSGAFASDESGSKPAKKSRAQPRTTPTKKPTSAKYVKKTKEDFEDAEHSSEYAPKKRKPRQAPDDAADKPPRNPRLQQGSRPNKPDQHNNRMRDIASSIVAHRRLDDSTNPDETPEPAKPRWLMQKEALKKKFPDGWQPIKRLSPDALAGIRALNAQFPDQYNVPSLSAHFKVSAENIRRILRSKWTPNQEEEEDRERRWHNRGKSIWANKAALGIKPPKKWREEGIARSPEYYEKRKYGIEREREIDGQEKAAYKGWREQFKSRRGDDA